jgi:creatinine amidohydrolase/Fe(II)-dependent formamide hydrolase-like protein
MDLATELGEQGFKWVFIVHGHGAPNHNRALDQACDYFCETFGGRMINLTGLMPVISAWDGKKSDAEREEDGLAIHAGMDETSMMLKLRPDLVDPRYLFARPLAGRSMESLIRIAESPDWPGYFGSPRLAEPSQAANGWRSAAQQAISLALSILDGLDEKTIARFGDEMSNSKADVRLDKASRKHEGEIKLRQHQWLKCHRLR